MGGLHFAMVTTFYPPFHFGGDAVFLRRLCHALVRRGHTVEVLHDVDAFSLLHPGPLPQPEPEPEGITTHPLRSALGPLSSLATHQSGRPLVHGRRIARILEQERFDVIHFHNVSLIGGPGILSYGSALKLYTAHEHWLVCPTHVLWRHNRELCTGRECLRCVLHYRRPPQLWRATGLLERQARHIDAFTSPSAFSARKHREFGFERDFEVIPYFLPEEDPGGGGSRDAAKTPDGPYFLFVGRLEKIKGVQDLLPHFGEGAPADLLVVGTGGYETALRTQAEGLERVHFLGRLDSAQLRPLYRHALAVLVPSLCYETFGIVALEAFRESTPVIARALGPLTEIVEESHGGLLFDDAAGLRAALGRLARQPELRRRLGEAGRRAFVERWSEAVVVEQYLALVERLLAERGGRRSPASRPPVSAAAAGE